MHFLFSLSFIRGVSTWASWFCKWTYINFVSWKEVNNFLFRYMVNNEFTKTMKIFLFHLLVLSRNSFVFIEFFFIIFRDHVRVFFLPAFAYKFWGYSRNTMLSPCWSILEFWKIKLENSSLTNWIFSLQKSISKLIFAGYTGSKNSVWNRLKIQFVELNFSKLIFQKSSTDQHGDYLL